MDGGGPQRPRADATAGPAPFTSTPTGRRLIGDGWLVAHLDDLAWEDNGRVCRLYVDANALFTQYGLNLVVARPGCPASMYHREEDCDETFIVLDGTAVACVAGTERAVHAGDIIHLPTGTGPDVTATLMVGARDRAPGPPGWAEYLPNRAASRYGAAHVDVHRRRPHAHVTGGDASHSRRRMA